MISLPTLEERFPGLTDTEDIAKAGLGALRPPDRITVSQWADRYRILDSRSPEPGRWRTSRVPYMREPMDRMSVIDSAQIVIIQGGAQIAKTEGVHNSLGYLITEAPGPTLVVQSTVDLGKDWCKDRFQSLVDTTPRLQPLIGSGEFKEKDGDNTLRYKRFPGGALFVAGANSPAGLRSKPIRYLFMDEVDSYPASAGKEGDPVQLAIRRTSNFVNRKILMISTPTIKGESRIALAYEASDMRRYFMPCPHCGSMQYLKWDQVVWKHTGKAADAYYACEANGCVIDDNDKTKMLALGEWRATRPEKEDGVTYGYHIPGLLSPWRTFAMMAEEFVKANPPGRPPDLELLQVFINTVLGEVWDDTGGREVNATEQMQKRRKWWEGADIVIPKAASVLTAGVDVQDDRLEVAVWAWGPGKEAWLIDYRKIYQSPTAAACWDDLSQFLTRTYTHESGVHLPISTTCVDAGYITDEVLDFCHVNKARRWYSIKGTHGMSKPIWSGAVLAGTKKNKSRNCFPVGVDGAKSWIYTSLNLDKGRIHFPTTEGTDNDFCTEQFFTQLCVEKRRPKYQGGREIWTWWKPDHARNEALDTMVYALAALESLLLAGKRLDRVPDGVPRKDAASKDAPSKTEVKAPEASSAPAKARPESDRAPVRGSIPPMRDWLRRRG